MFSGCSNLQNIIIPDNVTEIGYTAFGWCEKLTSITIGSGVQSIITDAFERCYNLEEIIFGGSVTQWNALTGNPYWGDVKATKVIWNDGEAELV